MHCDYSNVSGDQIVFAPAFKVLLSPQTAAAATRRFVACAFISAVEVARLTCKLCHLCLLLIRLSSSWLLHRTRSVLLS